MLNRRTILKLTSAAAVVGTAPHAVFGQAKPPPANLRLAVLPLTNFAPLVVARDKGYFVEENLNVTWTTVNLTASASTAARASRGWSGTAGAS
jgi:ABC-type nitrate/sulfonate/bicarbonate transport system substrate-binding protein